MEVDDPDRAPIAYPVLFGNVLRHVVAAMCATCGRARARIDSLDVLGWMQSCMKLLEIALSSQSIVSAALETTSSENVSLNQLQEACSLAASAAGIFLVDAGTVFQVLVPGCMAKYATSNIDVRSEPSAAPPPAQFATILSYFKLEPIDQMKILLI
jgi:hypothetical protein